MVQAALYRKLAVRSVGYWTFTATHATSASHTYARAALTPLRHALCGSHAMSRKFTCHTLPHHLPHTYFTWDMLRIPTPGYARPSLVILPYAIAFQRRLRTPAPRGYFLHSFTTRAPPGDS